MITLTGYKIDTELHRGDKSIVYRGEKSGKPVVVKYLNEEYPTQIELERFRKEFDFLQKISLPCVVKPVAFEKYNNSPVLVFEDIQGKSLRELLKEKSQFSIPEFLEIAILAVKALGELHTLGVVHKDIKPHNLIYNPDTKVLQIIDFGNATLLTRENPSIKTQNLEGTLSYISPEQTGRMNRSIDYRTDYYSLGVTFYQLLTGVLPFPSKNPMELVYAHLAKKPTPPSEGGLSDIILKLLEKNPEDRYQSTNGILHDLKECLNRWETEGKIDSFLLATKDRSTRFQIPEHLYGRETESERLIRVFEKASRGALALALVSGQSGIGKTALIQEVQKPIVEYRGQFISGKFDKFKRNMPYYALIQAFRNLVEQILTLDRSELEAYKTEILTILGVNGKVITDIIPELELIIGEQPATTELSAVEAQNRLNLLFLNLLQVFCKEDHPLVLFLDDLQWADISSLNLLKTILSDGSLKSLFIILSYRSNEVDSTHPFSILLEDVKKSGLEMEDIFINPLGEKDVNQLVADTLDSDSKSCLELSEIIHSKTEGNPFFVNSVFRSLYRDGVVYYHDSWKWEVSKVKQIAVSENVIEHTRANISLLSPEKKDLLKLAACVGNWFIVSVFARIIDKSLSETEEILAQIANEGYLLLGGGEARFAHDKIREATYTFITDEEKSKNHHKIGTTFLDLCKEGLYELDDFVFTIVNQLNQGIIHITADAEKEMLLDLNLKAVDKALASSAYESALLLIRVASALLTADAWGNQYEKTFEVYIKLARLEYLNGNSTEAEGYFESILARCKETMEKVSVYEIQIRLYVGQNKPKEALDIGFTALELLGVEFPENPDPTSEMMRVTEQIGSRSIEEILDFPVMKDAKKSAAMRILAPLIITSFIGRPHMLPLIVLKMVNLSLEFGNHVTSPFGYVFYGVLLVNVFGQVDAGFRFGKISVQLVEKLNAKQMKPSTVHIFACMINHWKQHAKENISLYKEVIETAKEVGDFQYGSYAGNLSNMQLFLMSKELSFMVKQFDDYYDLMKNVFKQQDATSLFELWAQCALNLAGDSEDILILNGRYFNEQTLSHWLEVKNFSCLCCYYSIKSALFYLFSSEKSSYDYAEQAVHYEGGTLGIMTVPFGNFFYSLSCLALLESPNSSEEDKIKYSEQIQKNQERMKVWGENCPANYGHKYYIVEAERERLAGNTDEALELYDKAISLAKEHEYLLEEAIANELAAKYWFAQKKEAFAKAHIIEAHYAYQRWGCKPKLAMMEKEYSYLKG